MAVIYRNPSDGDHDFDEHGHCRICHTPFGWGQQHLEVECKPPPDETIERTQQFTRFKRER